MIQRIGFDIDGVIAIPTIPKTRINNFIYYQTCVNSKISSLFPKDKIFLITGRSQRYTNITLEWLRDKEVKYNKIFFFPKKLERNYENTAIYKAKIIEKHGIEKYYDDNSYIGVEIKIRVPNCEIYIVREGNLLKVIKV